MGLKLLDVVSIEVVTKDGARLRGRATQVVVPVGNLRVIHQPTRAKPVRIVHGGKWNPWLFKPLCELLLPRERGNERVWSHLARWEASGDVTHIAHLTSMSMIEVIDKLGATSFQGARRINAAIHRCGLHLNMKTYLNAAGFPWKDLV